MPKEDRTLGTLNPAIFRFWHSKTDGVVKAGIWKANRLEQIVPIEELTTTVRDATLCAEAARVKVESLKQETLRRRL